MAFNATFNAVVLNFAEKALIQEAPLLKAFALDANLGASTAGQTVKARFRGVPGSASRYDSATNNYETATAPDLDEVNVTLLTPLKITKKVEPKHLVNGLELQAMIEDIVRQLLSDIFADACTVVTLANYGAAVFTGASTLLTSDKMSQLSNITAQGLGWMVGKRMAILNSTYYGNLATDDDLKSWGSPAAEEQINTAIIRPTASGWKAWNAPQVPANGENLVGFITDGTGIVIASALDTAAPGVEGQLFLNQVVQVPGAPVIQVVGHATPKDNSAYITVKSLSTPAKARAAGLKRLTSA